MAGEDLLALWRQRLVELGLADLSQLDQNTEALRQTLHGHQLAVTPQTLGALALGITLGLRHHDDHENDVERSRCLDGRCLLLSVAQLAGPPLDPWLLRLADRPLG